MSEESKRDEKGFIKQNKSPNKYDIYLNTDISKPEDYIDFFDKLKTATSEDKINIHLNSNGGLLDTTIQIINNIEECKAEVTTILNGVGHSSASIIFLSGHKKEVKKSSYMLCHYYSGGMYGKGNELLESSKFHDKHLKNFFRRVYNNFLTTKELDRLFKGEDFWFNDEEIKERLNIKND